MIMHNNKMSLAMSARAYMVLNGERLIDVNNGFKCSTKWARRRIAGIFVRYTIRECKILGNWSSDR